MTTFTPPVGDGPAWGDYEDPDPHERLLSFIGNIPTGETVWLDEEGVWHQEQYPTWGNEISTVHDWDGTTVSTPSPGLGTAQKVYLGSHIHDITTAEALGLIAAGYSSRLNIAPVKGTWTTEELRKFDSKMTLTDPDHLNISGPPFVSDNNKLTIRLSSGITLGQSGLREWFLHSDTAGWTDTHGIVEIDPPLFAIDYQGDPLADVLPQMGVVLRAQFNSSTGKNQGITLNNNTIFGLSMLNIGAWHAFPDGTGFANRQFQWPLFESLPLPYGWEWELIGNNIRVRIFPAGESPEVTPWSHPTHARTVNLDFDTGVVPTPTGQGTNGVIAAHLGTHPLSAVRIRRFEMERLL